MRRRTLVDLVADSPKDKPQGGDSKRCRCGASYDRESWHRLSMIGVQHFEGEEPLELRHCESCSNTLARHLRR